MENWRLIDLGMAEPYVAQCFYEAVALAVDRGLSPSTIILVQPSSPYVCLGYHQVLEKEIDIEYCRERGLPIIRRSQGGGAVYLNSDQIFYQVVASEDSKVIPRKVDELFEKLLQVTVYVYRELGLNAEFKPLNDVMVNNRKISGNGAGRIGKTIVLVGNIILDLDYDSMARVLKIPDEKFRDKMAKSMKEWVTSIRRELGYIPPIDEIKKILVEGYEKILGIKLIPSEPSEDEMNIFEREVKPKHLSYEWLHMPELTHKGLTIDRAVKIADGIKVIEVAHKARKLIKVTAEVIGDKILDIMITGDFFMVPEDGVSKIEAALKGMILNREEIAKKIREVFEKHDIQSPGISAEDFADAIMRLKEYTEKYPPEVRPFAEPEKKD